jgi:hypothetical protein
MARVSRYSASMAALVILLASSQAFAQCDTANCGEGEGGGSIRDDRDVARDDQRDPIIEEATIAEDLIFTAPPVFNLPASNAPVTRQSSGQIRSSWAVGVFR